MCPLADLKGNDTKGDITQKTRNDGCNKQGKAVFVDLSFIIGSTRTRPGSIAKIRKRSCSFGGCTIIYRADS